MEQEKIIKELQTEIICLVKSIKTVSVLKLVIRFVKNLLG